MREPDVRDEVVNKKNGTSGVVVAKYPMSAKYPEGSYYLDVMTYAQDKINCTEMWDWELLHKE